MDAAHPTDPHQAEPGRDDDLPVLQRLADLADLAGDGCFVRFSKGPDRDRGRTSRDYESGLDLPGLSVNPLCPEAWWERPVEDWLARQLCSYVHLMEEADDERRPWVLRGEVVGRGPDNEPLVADFAPLAWLSDALVREAKDRYEACFDVAEDST
jgi:hypothetical protein